MMTKEKRVTAFKIDRAIWLRGEGHERSALLRVRDGKRCCDSVGIYLSACGVPDENLQDVRCAENVVGLPKQAKWLITGEHRRGSSNLAQRLYTENDNAAKESAIAALFAEQGITVTFTGKRR